MSLEEKHKETQAALSQATQENVNLKMRLAQLEGKMHHLLEEMQTREATMHKADSDTTAQISSLQNELKERNAVEADLRSQLSDLQTQLSDQQIGLNARQDLLNIRNEEAKSFYTQLDMMKELQSLKNRRVGKYIDKLEAMAAEIREDVEMVAQCNQDMMESLSSQEIHDEDVSGGDVIAVEDNAESLLLKIYELAPVLFQEAHEVKELSKTMLSAVPADQLRDGEDSLPQMVASPKEQIETVAYQSRKDVESKAESNQDIETLPSQLTHGVEMNGDSVAVENSKEAQLLTISDTAPIPCQEAYDVAERSKAELSAVPADPLKDAVDTVTQTIAALIEQTSSDQEEQSSSHEMLLEVQRLLEEQRNVLSSFYQGHDRQLVQQLSFQGSLLFQFIRTDRECLVQEVTALRERLHILHKQQTEQAHAASAQEEMAMMEIAELNRKLLLAETWESEANKMAGQLRALVIENEHMKYSLTCSANTIHSQQEELRASKIKEVKLEKELHETSLTKFHLRQLEQELISAHSQHKLTLSSHKHTLRQKLGAIVKLEAQLTLERSAAWAHLEKAQTEILSLQKEVTSLRKERETRTSNEAVWQLEIEQLRRHLLQLQHEKSTTSHTATSTSAVSPSTTAPVTAVGGSITPVSQIHQAHPSHTNTVTSTPLRLSTTSAGKRSSAAVVRSHSSKRRGKVTIRPTTDRNPFQAASLAVQTGPQNKLHKWQR